MQLFFEDSAGYFGVNYDCILLFSRDYLIKLCCEVRAMHDEWKERDHKMLMQHERFRT